MKNNSKLNSTQLNKYMNKGGLILSKTFNEKQFNLYKRRLNSVNLSWCNQIIDLIKYYNINSINDIGCNYFQFYKELKLRKLNKDYFGYDIDEKFIKLGLAKFPELKNKYKIGNCEEIKLFKRDFSVMSSVLEHSVNPMKLLDNVLVSTQKIICIRTYLGIKSQKSISEIQKNQIIPYNVNQFSFDIIENKLKKFNFKTFFILDKFTNNSTKFKLINNTHKKHMYIVLGVKNILPNHPSIFWFS